MNPRVALLMITHNRLAYTKRSLFTLLRVETPFQLVIVDNCSTDGTKEYLATLRKPNVKLEFNSKHQNLSTITNRFWRKHHKTFEFVGKVDNDTLVSPGWLDRLIRIHDQSKEVGAIGGFSFDIYADWNFEHSKQNVRALGSEKILVQPNIGGCSYIIRASVINRVGYLDECVTVTHHGEKIPGIIRGWSEWLEQAYYKHGMVHGYPFPLEVVEHMDDPLSPHCLLDTDTTVTELARKNARQRGLEYSREAISKWIRGDGQYLFSEYVYRGLVGKRVY